MIQKFSFTLVRGLLCFRPARRLGTEKKIGEYGYDVDEVDCMNEGR